MRMTTKSPQLTSAVSTLPQSLAPGRVESARVHTSKWSAPVQGIGMSAASHRLGSVAGLATVVTASAAIGAERNRATGNPVFEDPI